jgi:hypothetical protein
MNPLLNPLTIRLVALRVASQFHENWRKTKKAGQPVWKATKDQAWLAQHYGRSPSPFAQPGGVNINIDFALLPEDWTAENVAAAISTTQAVANAMAVNGNRSEGLDIEALAAGVHDDWMARQTAKMSGTEDLATFYPVTSGQYVPYASLTEPQKEEDRKQVRVAILELEAALAAPTV